MTQHSLISSFYFLTTSFKNHQEEIIELTFNDKVDIINVRAFRILLTIRLINDDIFEIMHKILNTTQSRILIHRIATIIENNVRLNQHNLQLFFPFITELLNFSDNEDILDLFTSLARDATLTRVYTRFLQSVNISATILSLLTNHITKLDSSSNTTLVEKISGLFRIICILSHNEYLKLRFTTERSLNTITTKFHPDYIHILNQQWSSFLSLLNSTTADYFRDKVDDAINNICFECDRFSEYQVNSILFLSKLVEIDKQVIDILENNEIYKKLWDCMQRFPLHTSLHQIVINFIKPLLSTEHLSKIITFYIPNLIIAYKAREARILSASSLYLLKKMYKYKEGKEIIDTFQDVSEELKEKFELFHQSHQRSRLQSPSFGQWNLKHGFFADDKFGFI